MFPLFKRVVAFFAGAGVGLQCCAAEPIFRPHDVVALVGGGEMVALSEYGYLEARLTRALPEYRLRFRSLAWEGDTVFEQRRDLNFPPLEEQLTKVGATVVIAQFGQMESIGRKGEGRKAKDESGTEEIPEFTAAYEKLIDRLLGEGTKKRRILLLAPVATEQMSGPSSEARIAAYSQAAGGIARGRGLQFIDFTGILIPGREVETTGKLPQSVAHAGLAARICRLLELGGAPPSDGSSGDERLRAKIIEKNRLWFHYWRPQNWAFLNGDRTVQPSSRDHVDPSKRWFPAEIEQFIPLIEAKEREIDQLAAKLAQP